MRVNIFILSVLSWCLWCNLGEGFVIRKKEWSFSRSSVRALKEDEVNGGIELIQKMVMRGVVASMIAIMATTVNLDEQSIMRPALAMEVNTVEEVRTLVKKYYINPSLVSRIDEEKYDKEADQMKAATEMIKSLGDKYSRVLDEKAYSAIQKYDLIGVGATLMPDSERRLTIGAPPIPDSAADQAGLKYGDIILKMNDIPTAGRSSFDIIDQIDPNAKSITFTIERDAQPSFDVTLNRAVETIKNPISYRISETREDGTIVGYIRISEFNSLVNRKLKEALLDLEKSKHANAYVIDLRSNPGGAFQSAVEVASYFLDNQVATYAVDNNLAKIPFKTSKDSVLIDQNHPVVIWVDSNTASASEVFAAALHDNCRAVIMSKQPSSFGKGLIQAVYGLKNGAGLVLTVAKYVTPNGLDIQGKGLTPDIVDASSIPPLLSTILFQNADTSKIDFLDKVDRIHDVCIDQTFTATSNAANISF